ncbi:MAG: DUF2341 domain-containing protein [Patescibacteria group bacterium]|nr:DUF2341 domain-containing protein [Patescibacteria group bacterium]
MSLKVKIDWLSHPRIQKIQNLKFHRSLHWVMLGLTILVLGIGVSLDIKQKTKTSSAATFTKTWTSYNDFNYSNGVSGTTSTQSGVTINGSGNPTDANSGTVTLASTSSSKTQTTDNDFNGGTFNNTAVVNTGSSANVVSKSSSWWDVNYNDQKQLTVINSTSSATLSAGTTVSINVNTKSLYDSSKLRADCNDLRIVYYTNSTFTELNRSVDYASGATNCSDSTSTIIYFKTQADIAANASDSNYYLYYGYSSASAPTNTLSAFNVGTASATFVTPFNGDATAMASGSGTPTTATGAVRYSGGKTALSFGGADWAGTVNMGTSSTLDLTGTFTIEFWLRPQSGDWGDVFTHTNHGGGGLLLAINGSSLQLQTFSSGGHAYNVGILSFNTWQHVALVVSDTTETLYLNGVSQGSQTIVTPASCSGCTANMNLNGKPNAYDEYRISNVSRYSGNFTPPTFPFVRDANTLLLYHFDENGTDPRNVGKAIDDSGNGLHGTITGSAKYIEGVVGVDSSYASSGNVPSQPYASHNGVFVEEATTNKITNPSFENTIFNLNWTADASISATDNTTAPYYKFGTHSAKLVDSTAAATFITSINAGNTNTQTLSAYAYNNTSGSIGGTVDGTVVKLVFNGAPQTTTYTDMGEGWWRLTYSVAGIASAQNFGVEVEANKTIYLDGVQLEEKAYPTSYADGSLGSGYSWSGTVDNSISSRAGGSLEYSSTDNLNVHIGAINVWIRPNFDWLDGAISGSASERHRLIGNSNCAPCFWFDYVDPGNTDPRRLWFNTYSPSTGINGPGYTPSPGKDWRMFTLMWNINNGGSNNDTLWLYENGVLKASTTYTVTLSFLDGLRLGTDNDGPGHVVTGDVTFSDFRVFNNTLTTDQITSLYYAGLTSHFEASESTAKYATSGDFTSSVIDLGQNSNFGTLAFTSSAPANTTLQYRLRAATSSGAVTSAAWYGPTSTSDYYTSTGTNINSTLNGNHYVQYKAFFTTTDQTQSPSLSDIILNYSYYPSNTWYNSAWDYRKKITLDHTKVSGDQTYFPVLINRTDTDWRDVSHGGKVYQSDGGDILFTSSDRTTKLDHEIESYNALTGALSVWVKVPALSSTADTDLYIYYGNSVDSANQWNINGTWDDGGSNYYKGVWHLDEDPSGNAPQLADSTSNGNNGTSNGSMTSGQQTGGVIGGSLNFDGSDNIDMGSPTSLNNLQTWTYETWVNHTENPPTDWTWFMGKSTYSSGEKFFGFNYQTNNLRSFFNGSSGDRNTITNEALSPSTWYHVVTTCNIASAQDCRIYINGVEATYAMTSNETGSANNDAGNSFRLAQDSVSRFGLNGRLDEARVSSIARSATWITTEYNNESSPSTFYSVASEEVNSSGKISNLILDTTTQSSWGTISWNASTTSATSVKFRVRSASISADLPSAAWSAILSPSGSSLSSVLDNQYLELEIDLASTDTSQTPTLNDVTLTYVQNAPPTVATPSASLASDGTGIVTVNYQMSDPEDGLCTDSGICNSADNGTVNVTFQYSTDSATWSNASTVSQTGMTVTSGVIAVTSVHQSSYTPPPTYTVTWNAKTDLGTSIDYALYYLRLHADDGNATKNITNSSSTSLTIDTKSPITPTISVTASPSVTVDGTKRTSSPTVTLNLSVTDNDSSKYMMIKVNDNTFSGGTWESFAATKSAYSLITTSSNLTNTIYVKFKDSSGNESTTANDTIVYDTSAPNTPTNLKIADISDVTNNDYRLVLSWSRVDNPSTNDFSSYQIFRSTDGTTYDNSPLTTITDRTKSYYVDQGLTKDQKYYYKVKSADSLGNASNLTEAISAAPNVGDITPPALASGTTITITTTSTTATFTFTTNDISTGYVDFWLPNQTKKTVGEVDSVSSQNPHSITLTNLTSGTTYNYRVRATSVTNFEGKTKTSTLEENKTFATSSNVTISNVTVSNISTGSALIRWSTSENSDGAVDYGTTTNLGSAQEEASTNNISVSGNAHSVLLTNLTPGTTYYYRVQSGNSYYPDTNTSPSSFTTASLAKVSTTPPSISGGGPTVTPLSTSVTVTWTTDKSSDSYVEFGLTSSYGTNTGLDDSTLAHSVTLTGLTPSTIYHFRVKSKDSDGNTGYSSDSTFTTKDKSVITEVTISDISLTSAILSWTTNVISKSKVIIGTKVNSYSKEIQEESTDKTLNHVARIKDLTEGTKYYLRIVGTDGDANNITSDDYPFSTISKPVITNVKVKGANDHSITITWTTNVESDSTVSYGKTKDKLETDKGKSDLLTNHEVKLTNLDDNTNYYYQVKSRDIFGNLGEGEIREVTTSTDITPPAISEVKSEASLVGSGETARIQIIVSWSTDEPSTSQVEYDEGVGGGNIPYSNKTNEDKTLNQSHIIIISGLKPATTYHFRVVSKDKIGNASKSTEYTVLTPPKDVSTLQLILKSWEETFAWVNNLKKVIPLWPF